MTAPLAWLYAIPYERFQSPVDAMRLNLITLGVVAAWRVALMVRVLMVILNYSVAQALFLVLLFGDAIALLLIQTLPFPLIDIMGGIRLTEPQRLLRDVAVNVALVGGCSLPVWGVGSARPPFHQSASLAGRRLDQGRRRQSSLAGDCLRSGMGCCPSVDATGADSQKARRESHGREAFPRGLAEMSRLNRSDFPPGWDPPPRYFDLYDDHDDVRRVAGSDGQV